MSFASVTFLLFLPLVFALHWARPGRRWQNAVLLGASYVFYGWWDWRFCGLMLLSSSVDFVVSRGLAAVPLSRPRVRQLLLAVSLTVDLGLLGFFKYFNFFTDSLALAFAGVGIDIGTSTLNVVLPVGISFYTFQSLSYTIDVYRGQLPAHRDPVEYLAFVSFFPQLVAGPIERAAALLPQFAARRVFSREYAVWGCQLMLWGLAKKMLVANNLGAVVDGIYGRSATAGTAELTWATCAFAFQIYADFSGYSDIAAGVAALFGIRLTRNFVFPYFSRSPAEFWHRWHVTLSRWMRDYVFIPLGGSRGTLPVTIRNLLITFLVSGLWHGAAWHFVAWGALHGIGVALRRRRHASPGQPTDGHAASAAESRKGAEAHPPSLSDLPSILGTFAFVVVGWVFFRAGDLEEALSILGRITIGWFDPSAWAAAGTVTRDHFGPILVIATLVVVEWMGRNRWNPIAWDRWPRAWRWLGYTMLVWAVILWGTRRSAEFIYFQF